MKMIVGLGNPGRKYRGTRHNVGFEVIARLHDRFDRPRATAKFNSEIAEIRIGDEKILLQSPLTYMNLSGQAVRAAVDYFRLTAGDLLVICDDFNLPLPRLRVRPSGSGGGQNGLQDIINRMGTPDFARLRIGIGPVPEGREPVQWVLGRFDSEQVPEIEKSCERAAEAAIVWVREGVDRCMNRFNAPEDQPVSEKRRESGRPISGADRPPENGASDNRPESPG